MTSQNNVDSQLEITLRKLENLVMRMQREESGVPINSVKGFMSVTPDVCTGSDIIGWLLKNLGIQDRVEALHLANMLAAHGYIFLASDSQLMVRDDSSHHRFQTPFFWPTGNQESSSMEYAVYLCKRVLSNKGRLQLDEYELEHFTRLRNLLWKKWELVYTQAEVRYQVDKTKSKLERRVLESQERAFWNLHRPPPGFVQVLEGDAKKMGKGEEPKEDTKQKKLVHQIPGRMTEEELEVAIAEAKSEVEDLKSQLKLRRVKASKGVESLVNHCLQNANYDPFLRTPLPSNPWVSDDPSFWQDSRGKHTLSLKQVRRWAFSFTNLLKDDEGILFFLKYLEKEFSAENLRFWLSCEEFKCFPLKRLPDKAKHIFSEYLSDQAVHPVNVDSRAKEKVEENMKTPTHFTFEPAQEHIFILMKTDSYPRFLKSEQYKALSASTPLSNKRGVVDVRKIMQMFPSPQKSI